MKVRTLLIRGGLLLLGVPALLVLAVLSLFLALFYFPNHGAATRGTLVVSGTTREYLLHAPKSHGHGKPRPLVISLHPAMSWPSAEMAISRWNEVADEHGFIVVYPAGTGHGARTWFMEGRGAPPRMPDVLFVSALIDRLEASYDIDPARIYVDGMSNGGGMAFARACVLSDRIAAVGMVSAARSLDWNWYPPRRAVPMIAFQGSADPVVPYLGGRTPVGPDILASVPAFTEAWARLNGCDAKPVESLAAPDVTRLQYADGSGQARVVLYTVRGGGHQWPGGHRLAEFLLGPCTRSIDATRLEWEFFQEHPLRGGTAEGRRPQG